MNTKRTARRVAAAMAASIALVLMAATPASATVSTFNVALTSGRITVTSSTGSPPPSQTFDVPGTGSCTGPSTTIGGSVNDVSGTSSATLNLAAPFSPSGAAPWYYLVATGSLSGTYSHPNLSMSGTVNWTVYDYNATTCTPGATRRCGGSVNLSAAVVAQQSPSGGSWATGNTFNVSSVSGTFNANTGFPSTCPSPLNGYLKSGSSITVTDNPADNPPTSAVFTQQ